LVDNKKDPTINKPVSETKTIGIDVGIKSFAVCSHGLSFESNRYLKNSLERLRCLQRRASRKKKGSNNRKKANKCVSILHERITNQRVDYCHKVTTGLIRDNQAETFVIEDLAVVNMLKNKKLSQAISDVSFGEFFRQLKYKSEWYGKNLIVIDRFAPSSKRCSDCGEINQELTLADREWTCVCGSHHDRDLNAAINIKHFGLQQVLNNSPVGSRGGPVESRRLRRVKKQELDDQILKPNTQDHGLNEPAI
jgi:putative transposase